MIAATVPRRLGVVCVLGLAVGGCGSGSTHGSGTSTPATAAKTATEATGAATTHAAPKQPARGALKTTHATTTTTHAAPTAAPGKGPVAKPAVPRPIKLARPIAIPIPAARTQLGMAREWSGNGSQVLGTIALPRNVVVHWTVSGGQFAVADGSGKLAISGKGMIGQSFAASGTYAAVKVTAAGKWTLTMASLGA